MRKLILCFAFLFSTLITLAQDNFNIDDLPTILVTELNKFRIKSTSEVRQDCVKNYRPIADARLKSRW